MNQPRPTDAEQAVAYAAAAVQMRADARGYMAVAASIQPQECHLTFGHALASQLRAKYEEMADLFVEAAWQAESISKDYAEHADGTHVPLAATDRDAARQVNASHAASNEAWGSTLTLHPGGAA